ncbi:hypothetical protein C8A01DRAFT_16471 [Parachaetomium inaequale]|uniref:Secreted protein n=1 Tax=Parachaetomium inaequale TaxID=2588326 RepID=A0AAN6SRP5_9PEZI|nr:hypothetical protein C8A01DRAFT_16471 [Parachaetomium inaequale]
MRLPTLAVLASVVPIVAADYMLVLTSCLNGRCGSQGWWTTVEDTYWVDANEGCRDPDVPSMWSLCMDWGNQRGHFFFEGQPKRCIRKVSEGWAEYGMTSSNWDEVPCTW